MFQFTTTLTYGLRFLIFLAGEEKKPQPLRKVAAEENISLPYLRKIIMPLERAGIIKSVRGPGGGFLLGRTPEHIPLAEVIGILSHSKVVDCLKGADTCRRYETCAVKELLEQAYKQFRMVFENKSLATII